MSLIERAFTDKDGFNLDWDQQLASGAPEAEMTELAKGVNLTSSVLAALNYLGQRGWDLVSVTSVPTSVLTASSSPPWWMVALVLLGYLGYQQVQAWRERGKGAWLMAWPVKWLGWLLVALLACFMSGLFLLWGK